CAPADRWKRRLSFIVGRQVFQEEQPQPQGEEVMLSLNLRQSDKESVQRVVEGLQKANPQEIDRALTALAHGNRGPVQRFLLGAYNHPLTWWIGLFQLQMQHGMWGQRWRGIASTRASTLWQVTSP